LPCSRDLFSSTTVASVRQPFRLHPRAFGRQVLKVEPRLLAIPQSSTPLLLIVRALPGLPFSRFYAQKMGAAEEREPWLCWHCGLIFDGKPMTACQNIQKRDLRKEPTPPH
jgi:hypothetical protein